jgi:hypothetical protein
MGENRINARPFSRVFTKKIVLAWKNTSLTGISEF